MSDRDDVIFPALHIRPPSGWLNDPNGVCRIDDRYHVFFQYNPDRPDHANVHWGHVSSTDLLTWRAEPVALAPRPGELDAGGCWSGCVVDDDGVPTAVYTAVRRHAWDCTTVLARSDRTLQHWTQDTTAQVGLPADELITEIRDPYLFDFDGHRYAVQGGGRPAGPPRILVYRCDELTDWEELGDLLDPDDPVAAEVAPAQMWECPNLFQLDGRWVLLVSLWRFVNGTYALSGVRYLLGDLEARAGGGIRFAARTGGSVDTGPTCYAPQVLAEADRALLWGWAWEAPEHLDRARSAGWAGVLTFPRELTLSGDRLVSRPATELEQLRVGRIDLDEAGRFEVGPPFEVISNGSLELSLVEADGSVAEQVLNLPEPARVLVDGSIVEVFLDGPSATSRHYPEPGQRWQLGAAPGSISVWRLAVPPTHG